MVFKKMMLVVMALLTCGTAFAAGEADLRFRVAKPGADVSIDRVIKDGRALVNVVDAAKEPVIGLKAADFSVSQAGRAGMIVSAQPIAESMDVPRHIVLVLDNSYSMYERKAISALLAGVDELLKTVRPIDDVLMIAFDNNNTVKLGGRNLHAQSLRSNQPAELRAFAARAYQTAGLTAGTVLYEAILAGLDAVAKMPDSEPRFMVVFSDGEDLNSTYKSDVVLRTAREIKRFNAYTIDYLEGQATSKFLARFARENNGQVFKAKSETNLVPIFQSVASKMLYYYVVNYQFPPTGKLAVSPAELTVDEIKAGTAAPVAKISTSALTLRPVVDTAYGIARWKAVVSNTTGTVAELAGEGTPAAELKIPLPTTALQTLAANGDLSVKLDIEDRNGQRLALDAPPVKIKLVQTRASLAVAPAGLRIDEIKTIDVSPMLGYIFFDKTAGEIPARYVRLSGPGEKAGFDEQKFSGTLDKYYQDLNIIGKRLADKPGATVTLVGCNDNTGKEKGNRKLSTQRAEAVRDYLKTAWDIAPERMKIEVRNLPAKPSSARLPEGQAENRRVEILSTDPAILAPIRSTYVTTRADASLLTLRPDVVAPYGIAGWKATASNVSGTLASQAGKGAPTSEISLPLVSKDLKALANGGDISVRMELRDSMGQELLLATDPVKVTFVQTSQRLAQKEGLVVQEKYALILFDFDKDTIGAQNQDKVNRIVERIKALPQAKVEIVGHTDTIGSEKYNQKLSERRALAVYKLLSAAYGAGPADLIRYSGVGPNNPLFDNLSPEARSFNRTVTITLEYLSVE
jgi:outer membrane protein OmpA-like peptidoglycan-associated protein